MRNLILLTLTGILAFSVDPAPAIAQAPAEGTDLVREWEMEWGGRTRDPYVAPDGKVWFVGQSGNYIAYFNPANEERRRFEIEDGTNPHNLIVDENGFVWYAGNRNGRIGKLNPETGEAQIFPTGEARDPHTLIFDGKGNIWFTSQGANRVGRLNMSTGEVDLITPYETPSNPYGIVLDSDGNPWVSLRRTNQVARVNPETLEVTLFSKAHEDSWARRLEVTADGMVWYGDEGRGYLGRINPSTGEVTEWPMPGGEDARPYAITKDDRDILWISQTGPEKRLVAFDPRVEAFISVNEVSHNIRHMMFDAERGAMWFGTDANRVGRILTRRATP